MIQRDRVEKLPTCNHEEADTRLILHAAHGTSPAVIVAKDTDVLILLHYGMTQKSALKELYMKIYHYKYMDVRVIFEKVGSEVCKTLPQLHAITGCDTTTYKFNVGKVKAYRKVVKNVSSLALIKKLGKGKTVKAETIESAKKFIQTVLYNGKETETYVEIRVRQYLKMKVKSSAPLLPDPDSMCHEIKCIHLQCYAWLNCLMYQVTELNIDDFGWKRKTHSSGVTPVWFTGSQLPRSLIRSKTKSRTR